MTEPRCTYTADRGWMTPEHLASCREDCTGCRPCPKSHCEMHGRCANHVERGAGIYTCPSCIGKTRKRLAAILTRYAELPAEAEVAGVDSEALNLHGPAADPAQLIARRRWDETRGWCNFPRTIAEDDPHHPYLVLGRWDLALRESYGPATDLLVSVSRAVDYLAGPLLDTFAHTEEFEEFAGDVARCLSHLETVLSDSREPEKGAPCPTCAAALIGTDRKAARLLKRYGPTEAADTWHCADDAAHWWSDVDYRMRVDGDYVKHAEVLTMTDLPERTGIPAGTLRRWAGRRYTGTDAHGEPTYEAPLLVSCGKAGGRRLYRVADVLGLRNDERMEA